MVDWHDPKERLPMDGEECLLMPHDSDSIVTLRVYGPMPWNANNNVWFDFFATPAAAEMIRPDAVGCWTLWEPIKPPEGLPTPRPDSPVE